jgi:hypothetical protein
VSGRAPRRRRRLLLPLPAQAPLVLPLCGQVPPLLLLLLRRRG